MMKYITCYFLLVLISMLFLCSKNDCMKEFDVDSCTDLEILRTTTWSKYSESNLTVQEYDSLFKAYNEISGCYEDACE